MTAPRPGRRFRILHPDLLLVGALLCAAAATAFAVALSWGELYWAPGTLLALPVAGLALLRRGHYLSASLGAVGLAGAAVWISAVADLPAEPSPAMALALAVLTAAAVRHLVVAEAALVAVLGLLVVAASAYAHPGTDGNVPAVTVLNGACWLAALGAGIGMRLNDDRAHLASARARQALQLDLARELHDSVAHHITGIRVQAQAGQLVVVDDPQTAMRAFADIERAAASSLTAIRHVLGTLRLDAASGPDSLSVAGIGRLAEQLFPGGGPVAMRVELAPELAEAGLEAATRTTMFRIIQEALTNVARHAPKARDVAVRVDLETSHVRLEVTNDGVAPGHLPPAIGGFGLVGMQERARAVGGEVHAGHREPDSWAVVASLPREGVGRS